jgi:hypothetical protein
MIKNGDNWGSPLFSKPHLFQVTADDLEAPQIAIAPGQRTPTPAMVILRWIFLGSSWVSLCSK